MILPKPRMESILNYSRSEHGLKIEKNPGSPGSSRLLGKYHNFSEELRKMHGWAKIDNAAKYADVSKRTIRNWIKNGLPYSRMSRKLILIKLSDLDSFIDKFKVIEKEEVDRKINSIVDSICKDLDLK